MLVRAAQPLATVLKLEEIDLNAVAKAVQDCSAAASERQQAMHVLSLPTPITLRADGERRVLQLQLGR